MKAQFISKEKIRESRWTEMFSAGLSEKHKARLIIVRHPDLGEYFVVIGPLGERDIDGYRLYFSHIEALESYTFQARIAQLRNKEKS